MTRPYQLVRWFRFDSNFPRIRLAIAGSFGPLSSSTRSLAASRRDSFVPLNLETYVSPASISRP